jgi:plasmid rolling circle replication initiator protein Rep
MSDFSSDSEVYLSEVSPRDKPWDAHRSSTSAVQRIYRGTEFDRYAERMYVCSHRLQFALVSDETGGQRFKLLASHFCRVRTCPVCQWRRSLMWVARTIKTLPRVLEDYPKSRWIFLTLTVRNCPVTELKATLKGMNAAFKRLTKRKDWPGLGFIKSVEVTRNAATGEAHPHFHILVMVPPSYFKGTVYLSQQKWRELWQSVLRVGYLPVVNVKTVKPKGKPSPDSKPIDVMVDAIRETLKYSVKPDDMVADPAWLLELTTQLHNSRAVGVGGVLRDYFSEDEPEDLINADETSDLEVSESDLTLWFGWREMSKRYAKVDHHAPQTREDQNQASSQD